MAQPSTTIRLVHLCDTGSVLSPTIGRITGLVNAENFIKLMKVMTVDSNPRSPKESGVTREIIGTLQRNPSLFHFMSKGILLSASGCRPLERNRIELNFASNDFATPGILDGGHNTFAIAKYLLSYVLAESELKPVKDWATLIIVWRQIEKVLADLITGGNGEDSGVEPGFLIPFEVIYPRHTDDPDEMKIWGESHRDITHARNNNVQLTDSTKDHHQGFYDYLKGVLPENIAQNIEWKAGETGSIKAADVVALALIPLSKLPKSVTGVEVNLPKIYNSKQYCVETFRSILSFQGNGVFHGESFELLNPQIKSALDLVPSILVAYDHIYKNFPYWYNEADGSFGRITGVRLFRAGPNDNPKKYSSKPFSTKFGEESADYQFADGFILPLIVGLRSLIQVRDSDPTCIWALEPTDFLDTHQKKIMNIYTTVIRLAQWDPQKIGKDRGSYEIAQAAFNSANGV